MIKFFFFFYSHKKISQDENLTHWQRLALCYICDLEDVMRRTVAEMQNLANPLQITPRMLWMHYKQL